MDRDRPDENDFRDGRSQEEFERDMEATRLDAERGLQTVPEADRRKDEVDQDQQSRYGIDTPYGASGEQAAREELKRVYGEKPEKNMIHEDDEASE